MNDPLSQALEETTEPLHYPSETVNEHTSTPRAVRDILEVLKLQALEAVSIPFFDGDVSSDLVPIRSVGRAECGAVHIIARRREPSYCADVSIDVRCDLDLGSAGGRYQVTSRCVMSSGADKHHRDFIIETTLCDDGTLEMDVEQLRLEMAAAIHAMGKLPAE